ncbi:MAG: hypothetical protein M1813_008425 [Trichoglossum hirsutum]|nr:MAG: hypothetical protein M1813_008425 [Trichoglossum hirsutum]
MKKLTLLDLPVETQKDIFKHSTPQDLIALALVSRHFHSIASSQLWRSFGIVFPDDDDPAFDSPIDGLAGGLDTLVTSKHNYARYLKEISLDTLSGGDRGERAYKHWNIRVELNRSVFAALHSLPNLRHLHVRLQIGQSMYQAPPPLPSSATIASPPTADNLPPPSSLPPAPSTPPPPYSIKTPEVASKSNGTTPESRTEPPTFSGFKSLNTLAVLDIDCLSYVPELAACVHKSSLALKKVKLSLSEALAIKARKPGYDEMDDSDDDMVDELGNPINPPPTAPGATEGTLEKEAKVRAERSEQEAVLGKIFSIGKPASGKRADSKADSKEKPKPEEKSKIESSTTEDDAGKAFLNDLKTLKKLVETTPSNGSDTAKITAQEEALELILRAAEKFVGAGAKEAVAASSSNSNSAPGLKSVEGDSKDKSAGFVSEILENAKAGAESTDDTSRKGKEKATNVTSEDDRTGKVDVADGPGLFDTPSKDKSATTANPENSVPEDIDVEHPDFEEFEDIDDQEEVGDDVTMAQDTTTEIEKAIAVGVKKAGKDNIYHIPNGFVKQPETKMSGGLSQIEVDNEDGLESGVHDEADHKVHETTEKVNPLAEVSLPLETHAEIIDSKQHDSSDDQSVKDYIRSTRKISLRSFSLYLVPIRPSVLDRALDLTALHRITLLNVGPQAAFWTLMSNTHKKSPLQLKKIYTDNVTTEFLGFVSEIDNLTELFMLERTSKTKVESLAPKTTVGIEDIRKSVLQKHARSLKKLMIKNENDYSWDINGKAIRLLTKKGKNLAELAICVDLKNFHLLLQYISGLVSLKALYILTCRTDDTCQWVVRELRNFAIDNIAHYPELKLEYLALDSTVERVIRKKANPKRTKNLSSVESLLGGKEIEAKDSETSSDDENSDEDQQPGLKIETLGVKFYDVYGVRIFRKDVKAGIL